MAVSDEDGASASNSAIIYVQEQNDYPPTANAGEDVIVRLPQNKVTLNGNQSSDDHGIVSWEWTRKVRARAVVTIRVTQWPRGSLVRSKIERTH